MPTYQEYGVYLLTVPAGKTFASIQCRGAGGGGARGGGGGGAWARKDLAVTPGFVLEIAVGKGGIGGHHNPIPPNFPDCEKGEESRVRYLDDPDYTACLAVGGYPATGDGRTQGGAGGEAESCVGDECRPGGKGANSGTWGGGGGGGGARPIINGVDADEEMGGAYGGAYGQIPNGDGPFAAASTGGGGGTTDTGGIAGGAGSRGGHGVVSVTFP